MRYGWLIPGVIAVALGFSLPLIFQVGDCSTAASDSQCAPGPTQPSVLIAMIALAAGILMLVLSLRRRNRPRG